MKRYYLFAIFAITTILFFIPCNAAHAEEDATKEAADDITYIEETNSSEEYKAEDDTRSMGTVSDYNTASVFDLGVLQLYVKLDATFIYDGSSATCIANSASYNILNSDWTYNYVTTNRSGNTAWADFSFTNSVTGENAARTIYISCSGSGIIYKY